MQEKSGPWEIKFFCMLQTISVYSKVEKKNVRI